MFHIGKRTIKTAIALAITLSIYFLLYLIQVLFSIDPQSVYTPTNFYTPFFAGIATIYATQQHSSSSKSQAKLRSVGSIIGGYFGFVIIFVFELIYIKLLGQSDSDVMYKVWCYLITSLGILILIPLTVKLRKQTATFITCLTYLSVTISIRNGGMDPFLFATNRIISTIIGVLISLFVNTFPHFRKKNTNILFISSLDNAMLNSKHELSPFMKYKIDELIMQKANITFMTTRALTSLGAIFKDLALKLPIVVMNGSTMYYPETEEYKSMKEISSSDRESIEQVFKQHNIDYFTYLINENILHCYYTSLANPGLYAYYNARRNGAFYSFVQALTPKELNIAQYVIIEKNEIVEELLINLKKLPNSSKFSYVVYPFKQIEGYSFLKINSCEASKENSLPELKEVTNYKFLIAFGSGHTDIETMKLADFSVCLSSAPDYIKEIADYIIPSEEPDQIVRLISKIYFSSNYKKTIEKIKNNK